MDDMRKAFEAWWLASKYCQVVSPPKGWEQIAKDAWQAATLAERDRCAGLCDDNRDSDCFDGSFVASSIADAIRGN